MSPNLTSVYLFPDKIRQCAVIKTYKLKSTHKEKSSLSNITTIPHVKQEEEEEKKPYTFN